MGNSFTGFLSEAAGQQEEDGAPVKVGCANDAVRVWGGIDTTKVDVGKFATRIRAAQEPIPASSAEIVHTIPKAHDQYVRILTWDPFRDLLISGGGDGWIRLWNIDDYSAVGEMDAQLSVRALLVLTQELASGHSNGQVVIWAIEKAGWPQVQVIKAHREAVYALAMVRSGDLVTGAEDIRVFSRGGMMGGMLGFQLQHAFNREVLCMCTIPGGRYEVVTGDMNSIVTVWDVSKGLEPYKECKGHERSVWAVCYLREARRVVTGSADHTIRVWDTKTWITERVLRDHLGWVVGLSAGPRWLLSCSNDHHVRIWDCESWLCERAFMEQQYEVYCVCSFSGGRFATGGAEMAVIVYGGPEHRKSKKGSSGSSHRSSRGSSSINEESSQPRQRGAPRFPEPRSQGLDSGLDRDDSPPQRQDEGSSWLPSWLGGGGSAGGSASSAQRTSKHEQRGSRRKEEEDSYEPPPRCWTAEASSHQERRKQLLANTNLDMTMSEYHKHLVEAGDKEHGRGRRQDGGEAPKPVKSYDALDMDMTADHFSHVDRLVGTNFSGANNPKGGAQRKSGLSPRVTFSASAPEEKGVTEWKLERD